MTLSNVDDPRPTDSLDDREAWPLGDGAEQITVRVARWNDDGSPACYQAIVKHRDRKRPSGLGMLTCPVKSLSRAISEFYRTPTDTDGPTVDDLLG